MEENEKKVPDVPYFIYEGELSRLEAHIKRLLVCIVIMAVLLAASNFLWAIGFIA